MSKSSESIQIGTCPVCRAQMVEKDGFVICPNSNYKIEYTKWDEVWKAFENSEKKDGEKLLADLLALTNK